MLELPVGSHPQQDLHSASDGINVTQCRGREDSRHYETIVFVPGDAALKYPRDNDRHQMCRNDGCAHQFKVVSRPKDRCLSGRGMKYYCYFCVVFSLV